MLDNFIKFSHPGSCVSPQACCLSWIIEQGKVVDLPVVLGESEIWESFVDYFTNKIVCGCFNSLPSFQSSFLMGKVLLHLLHFAPITFATPGD